MALISKLFTIWCALIQLSSTPHSKPSSTPPGMSQTPRLLMRLRYHTLSSLFRTIMRRGYLTFLSPTYLTTVTSDPNLASLWTTWPTALITKTGSSRLRVWVKIRLSKDGQAMYLKHWTLTRLSCWMFTAIRQTGHVRVSTAHAWCTSTTLSTTILALPLAMWTESSWRTSHLLLPNGLMSYLQSTIHSTDHLKLRLRSCEWLLNTFNFK